MNRQFNPATFRSQRAPVSNQNLGTTESTIKNNPIPNQSSQISDVSSSQDLARSTTSGPVESIPES